MICSYLQKLEGFCCMDRGMATPWMGNIWRLKGSIYEQKNIVMILYDHRLMFLVLSTWTTHCSSRVTLPIYIHHLELI